MLVMFVRNFWEVKRVSQPFYKVCKLQMSYETQARENRKGAKGAKFFVYFPSRSLRLGGALYYQSSRKRLYVSSIISGMTRVLEITGIKFVSPLQRGTTCKWI